MTIPSDHEPVSPESILPADPEVPPAPERIIEAMLFAGGKPLTAERACEIIRGLTPEQFRQAVDALNNAYKLQRRPYHIQPFPTGYAMTLRSRFRNAHERLYGSVREAHLSQSAIDVLALVAYKQPATRQEIDNMRGVDSAGVLRQLVRRGLIAVVPRGETGTKEIAYGTTQRFLDFFGLTNVEDLPRTQDLQQI